MFVWIARKQSRKILRNHMWFLMEFVSPATEIDTTKNPNGN
jgi:hypothetical protein